MLNVPRTLFDLPDDVIYLNAAGAGPRLHSVNDAAHESVKGSARPWAFNMQAWLERIESLRALTAATLTTEAEALAFIPAASYGEAIAAHNVRVEAGQKILLMAGEYPSNRTIWQRTAEAASAHCVDVAPAQGESWTAAMLRHIDADTAVVSAVPCHWTNGAPLDLTAIGAAARHNGAALVVDASQSLGALPFDFDAIQPDFVVSAGHKWLLGALGLGWLWAAPRWRHDGKPIEETWLAREQREQFGGDSAQPPPYRPGAARFDAGGSAHPISIPMAEAAMTQLAQWSVEAVAHQLHALTQYLDERLATHGLSALITPDHVGHFTALRIPPAQVDAAQQALSHAGIVCARRGSGLRIAPHLHTQRADIDQLVAVLHAAL
ncbi:aminotransferase class V-fold PLP-dependent enzyme [Algiphilus sp.]|uniref:aminotransferase class V-fold PLP-dependent enzyme n=1 Tax=Algiphilus sp. TaxID=1872431 RepID=UPI003B5239A6